MEERQHVASDQMSDALTREPDAGSLALAIAPRAELYVKQLEHHQQQVLPIRLSSQKRQGTWTDTIAADCGVASDYDKVTAVEVPPAKALEATGNVTESGAAPPSTVPTALQSPAGGCSTLSSASTSAASSPLSGNPSSALLGGMGSPALQRVHIGEAPGAFLAGTGGIPRVILPAPSKEQTALKGFSGLPKEVCAHLHHIYLSEPRSCLTSATCPAPPTDIHWCDTPCAVESVARAKLCGARAAAASCGVAASRRTTCSEASFPAAPATPAAAAAKEPEPVGPSSGAPVQVKSWPSRGEVIEVLPQNAFTGPRPDWQSGHCQDDGPLNPRVPVFAYEAISATESWKVASVAPPSCPVGANVGLPLTVRQTWPTTAGGTTTTPAATPSNTASAADAVVTAAFSPVALSEGQTYVPSKYASGNAGASGSAAPNALDCIPRALFARTSACANLTAVPVAPASCAAGSRPFPSGRTPCFREGGAKTGVRLTSGVGEKPAVHWHLALTAENVGASNEAAPTCALHEGRGPVAPPSALLLGGARSSFQLSRRALEQHNSSEGKTFAEEERALAVATALPLGEETGNAALERAAGMAAPTVMEPQRQTLDTAAHLFCARTAAEGVTEGKRSTRPRDVPTPTGVLGVGRIDVSTQRLEAVSAPYIAAPTGAAAAHVLVPARDAAPPLTDVNDLPRAENSVDTVSTELGCYGHVRGNREVTKSGVSTDVACPAVSSSSDNCPARLAVKGVPEHSISVSSYSAGNANSSFAGTNENNESNRHCCSLHQMWEQRSEAEVAAAEYTQKLSEVTPCPVTYPQQHPSTHVADHCDSGLLPNGLQAGASPPGGVSAPSSNPSFPAESVAGERESDVYEGFRRTEQQRQQKGIVHWQHARQQWSLTPQHQYHIRLPIQQCIHPPLVQDHHQQQQQLVNYQQERLPEGVPSPPPLYMYNAHQLQCHSEWQRCCNASQQPRQTQPPPPPVQLATHQEIRQTPQHKMQHQKLPHTFLSPEVTSFCHVPPPQYQLQPPPPQLPHEHLQYCIIQQQQAVHQEPHPQHHQLLNSQQHMHSSQRMQQRHPLIPPQPPPPLHGKQPPPPQVPVPPPTYLKQSQQLVHIPRPPYAQQQQKQQSCQLQHQQHALQPFNHLRLHLQKYYHPAQQFPLPQQCRSHLQSGGASSWIQCATHGLYHVPNPIAALSHREETDICPCVASPPPRICSGASWLHMRRVLLQKESRPLRLSRFEMVEAYAKSTLCLSCDSMEHKITNCPFGEFVCPNCHRSSHRGEHCPLPCRFCFGCHAGTSVNECIRRTVRQPLEKLLGVKMPLDASLCRNRRSSGAVNNAGQDSREGESVETSGHSSSFSALGSSTLRGPASSSSTSGISSSLKQEQQSGASSGSSTSSTWTAQECPANTANRPDTAHGRSVYVANMVPGTSKEALRSAIDLLLEHGCVLTVEMRERNNMQPYAFVELSSLQAAYELVQHKKAALVIQDQQLKVQFKKIGMTCSLSSSSFSTCSTFSSPATCLRGSSFSRSCCCCGCSRTAQSASPLNASNNQALGTDADVSATTVSADSQLRRRHEMAASCNEDASFPQKALAPEVEIKHDNAPAASVHSGSVGEKSNTPNSCIEGDSMAPAGSSTWSSSCSCTKESEISTSGTRCCWKQGCCMAACCSPACSSQGNSCCGCVPLPPTPPDAAEDLCVLFKPFKSTGETVLEVCRMVSYKLAADYGLDAPLQCNPTLTASAGCTSDLYKQSSRGDIQVQGNNPPHANSVPPPPLQSQQQKLEHIISSGACAATTATNNIDSCSDSAISSAENAVSTTGGNGDLPSEIAQQIRTESESLEKQHTGSCCRIQQWEAGKTLSHTQQIMPEAQRQVEAPGQQQEAFYGSMSVVPSLPRGGDTCMGTRASIGSSHSATTVDNSAQCIESRPAGNSSYNANAPATEEVARPAAAAVPAASKAGRAPTPFDATLNEPPGSRDADGTSTGCEPGQLLSDEKPAATSGHATGEAGNLSAHKETIAAVASTPPTVTSVPGPLTTAAGATETAVTGSFPAPRVIAVSGKMHSANPDTDICDANLGFERDVDRVSVNEGPCCKSSRMTVDDSCLRRGHSASILFRTESSGEDTQQWRKLREQLRAQQRWGEDTSEKESDWNSREDIRNGNQHPAAQQLDTEYPPGELHAEHPPGEQHDLHSSNVQQTQDPLVEAHCSPAAAGSKNDRLSLNNNNTDASKSTTLVHRVDVLAPLLSQQENAAKPWLWAQNISSRWSSTGNASVGAACTPDAPSGVPHLCTSSLTDSKTKPEEQEELWFLQTHTITEQQSGQWRPDQQLVKAESKPVYDQRQLNSTTSQPGRRCLQKTHTTQSKHQNPQLTATEGKLQRPPQLQEPHQCLEPASWETTQGTADIPSARALHQNQSKISVQKGAIKTTQHTNQAATHQESLLSQEESQNASPTAPIYQSTFPVDASEEGLICSHLCGLSKQPAAAEYPPLQPPLSFPGLERQTAAASPASLVAQISSHKPRAAGSQNSQGSSPLELLSRDVSSPTTSAADPLSWCSALSIATVATAAAAGSASSVASAEAELCSHSETAASVSAWPDAVTNADAETFTPLESSSLATAPQVPLAGALVSADAQEPTGETAEIHILARATAFPVISNTSDEIKAIAPGSSPSSRRQSGARRSRSTSIRSRRTCRGKSGSLSKRQISSTKEEKHVASTRAVSSTAALESLDSGSISRSSTRENSLCSGRSSKSNSLSRASEKTRCKGDYSSRIVLLSVLATVVATAGKAAKKATTSQPGSPLSKKAPRPAATPQEFQRQLLQRLKHLHERHRRKQERLTLPAIREPKTPQQRQAQPELQLQQHRKQYDVHQLSPQAKPSGGKEIPPMLMKQKYEKEAQSEQNSFGREQLYQVDSSVSGSPDTASALDGFVSDIATELRLRTKKDQQKPAEVLQMVLPIQTKEPLQQDTQPHQAPAASQSSAAAADSHLSPKNVSAIAQSVQSCARQHSQDSVQEQQQSEEGQQHHLLNPHCQRRKERKLLLLKCLQRRLRVQQLQAQKERQGQQQYTHEGLTPATNSVTVDEAGLKKDLSAEYLREDFGVKSSVTAVSDGSHLLKKNCFSVLLGNPAAIPTTQPQQLCRQRDQSDEFCWIQTQTPTPTRERPQPQKSTEQQYGSATLSEQRQGSVTLVEEQQGSLLNVPHRLVPQSHQGPTDPLSVDFGAAAASVNASDVAEPRHVYGDHCSSNRSERVKSVPTPEHRGQQLLLGANHSCRSTEADQHVLERIFAATRGETDFADAQEVYLPMSSQRALQLQISHDSIQSLPQVAHFNDQLLVEGPQRDEADMHGRSGLSQRNSLSGHHQCQHESSHQSDQELEHSHQHQQRAAQHPQQQDCKLSLQCEQPQQALQQPVRGQEPEAVLNLHLCSYNPLEQRGVYHQVGHPDTLVHAHKQRLAAENELNQDIEDQPPADDTNQPLLTQSNCARSRLCPPAVGEMPDSSFAASGGHVNTRDANRVQPPDPSSLVTAVAADAPASRLGVGRMGAGVAISAVDAVPSLQHTAGQTTEAAGSGTHGKRVMADTDAGGCSFLISSTSASINTATTTTTQATTFSMTLREPLHGDRSHLSSSNLELVECFKGSSVGHITAPCTVSATDKQAVDIIENWQRKYSVAGTATQLSPPPAQTAATHRRSSAMVGGIGSGAVSGQTVEDLRASAETEPVGVRPLTPQGPSDSSRPSATESVLRETASMQDIFHEAHRAVTSANDHPQQVPLSSEALQRKTCSATKNTTNDVNSAGSSCSAYAIAAEQTLETNSQVRFPGYLVKSSSRDSTSSSVSQQCLTKCGTSTTLYLPTDAGGGEKEEEEVAIAAEIAALLSSDGEDEKFEQRLKDVTQTVEFFAGGCDSLSWMFEESAAIYQTTEALSSEKQLLHQLLWRPCNNDIETQPLDTVDSSLWHVFLSSKQSGAIQTAASATFASAPTASDTKAEIETNAMTSSASDEARPLTAEAFCGAQDPQTETSYTADPSAVRTDAGSADTQYVSDTAKETASVITSKTKPALQGPALALVHSPREPLQPSCEEIGQATLREAG